jgi:hypothetical protein
MSPGMATDEVLMLGAHGRCTREPCDGASAVSDYPNIPQIPRHDGSPTNRLAGGAVCASSAGLRHSPEGAGGTGTHPEIKDTHE